jgi:hypothetical protein
MAANALHRYTCVCAWLHFTDGQRRGSTWEVQSGAGVSSSGSTYA